MNPLPLNEVLKILEGTVISGKGNPVINHVATHFNHLKKGKHTLFFHLKPTYRFKRLRKYKNIIIVTENPSRLQTARSSHMVIKVKNVKDAFWNFIHQYRGLFEIPVIGVTGTSGKTTTKEMISQTLAMCGLNVQSTYGNYNTKRRNLLYFLNIDDQTDAAVIEMGVLQPGDIKHACRMFQPTIRILLNIGVYHLDRCKTLENYINAKAEIMADVKADDLLILNADDQNIKTFDVRHVKRKVYVGINEKVDFMAKNILHTDKGLSFTLLHNNVEYPAEIPVVGKHNIYNILASVAAVYYTGIDIKVALKKLSSFNHIRSHLQAFTGTNECSIIDDTWNNTPIAMDAALNVLNEVSDRKKKVAVLGYFPRLGESKIAIKQYQDLAKKVVEAGVEKLVIVDEKAKAIGENAIKLGMRRKDVHYCFSDQAAINTICNFLNPKTVILLKFSSIRRRSLYKLLSKVIKRENDNES